MSYGFALYNEGGYLQVDDTYSNHVIIQEGSLSIAGAQKQITIHYSDYGISPIVLCRHVSGPAVCLSDLTTSYATISRGDRPSSTANSVIDYAIAVPADKVSTLSTYGLAVRNGSGLLTFSTDYKYVRFATTFGFSNTNKSTFHHSYGHPYLVLNNAHVVSSHWWTVYGDSNPPYAVSVTSPRSQPGQVVYDETWFIIFNMPQEASAQQLAFSINCGVVL